MAKDRHSHKRPFGWIKRLANLKSSSDSPNTSSKKNQGASQSKSFRSVEFGRELACRRHDMLGGEKALGLQRRHAAEACRRHRLAIDIVGNVAGREHARDIGLRRAGLNADVAVAADVSEAVPVLAVVAAAVATVGGKCSVKPTSTLKMCTSGSL